MTKNNFPQNVGLGLNFKFIDEIIQTKPSLPWFEVLVDNFFQDGPHHSKLSTLREDYSITFHGVGMNLASSDPLSVTYLKKLKELKNEYHPAWVSDHLCWSRVQGISHHDLLPIPYTREIAKYIADRISKVQDILGEQILVENLSDYIKFEESEMNEAAFITEVTNQADCHILLDINNLWVNSENHQFNSHDFLDEIPTHRVKEIHIAGAKKKGSFYYDTHGEKTRDEVLELYSYYLKSFELTPTLLERDNNIPLFTELTNEVNTIQKVYDEYT